MSKKDLTVDDFGSEYKDKIGTQDYSKKPTIDGVKIIELKQFVDDGGSFNEVARINQEGVEGLEEFDLAQISYSVMDPGTVKAWHIHLRQEDVWFIPPIDKLVVGLVDIRKDSSTYSIKQKLALGSGKTSLVYIPRGVAHGAVNLSRKSGQIFYLVSQQFNSDDPDEKRLPWDHFGSEFWEKEKG